MSGPVRYADEDLGHDQIAVPARVVVPMIALILFAIAAVGVGRAEQMGVTHEGRLKPVEEATFRYTGAGLGAAPLIATGANGKRVVLAPLNEEIFPRLILRSLANIRARHNVDPTTPVELMAMADGQRLLVDPATGLKVRLAAFGPVNGHAFDALLPDGGA